MALALLAAAPAAATESGEVELRVIVEEIAVLETVVQSVSVDMTDSGPTVAGSASALGPTDGMARLRLVTNYCIDGLQFDFPTATGLRPSPAAYYGAATGIATGHTLGVQPFLRYDAGLKSFGSLLALDGRATDAPLTVSGSSGDFCNGVHDLFLGAVSRWDLTLPGEPVFAAPDTYRIAISATIIP